MDYEQARKVIKTGDLLAWSSNSIFGRMVRAFTGSNYSHVGLALWIEEGDTTRLLVAESREGKGVQVAPLSEQKSFDVVLFGGSKHEPDLRSFIWQNVGSSSYDWWSIVRRVVGFRMRDNNSYTCNEFGKDGLVKAKHIPKNSYAGDPHELVNIAKIQAHAKTVFVKT